MTNIPKRVRIQGKLNAITGYHIALYDVDTGEMIPGVQRVELVLDATQYNRVNIICNGREHAIDDLEINDVVAVATFEEGEA